MTNAHRRSNASVSAQFASVPRAETPRSVFNRSHNLKTTLSTGLLVPILADEILPGDTINCNYRHLLRMNTLIQPVMENIYFDTFFFFVPNRLLFDNWRKMMGEQDNPGDSIAFQLPTMTSPAGGYSEESLSDYLGLPINVEGIEHHSLFHRAYALIYNEWFRPQALIDSVPFDTGPGPDDPADYTLQRRAKRHDYFTSCLPWPTKDGQGVDLPIGGFAPVISDVVDGGVGRPYFDEPAYGATVGKPLGVFGSNSSVQEVNYGDGGGTPQSTFYSLQWNQDDSPLGTGLVADLGSGQTITVNAFREAVQLQRLFERDARAGTRYTEILRGHFNVSLPDLSWRPEYLGGGFLENQHQSCRQHGGPNTPRTGGHTAR